MNLKSMPLWQERFGSLLPILRGATLESKIRAVQKIMPAINNYFGVANNDIVSNKKNNLDKKNRNKNH